MQANNILVHLLKCIVFTCLVKGFLFLVYLSSFNIFFFHISVVYVYLIIISIMKYIFVLLNNTVKVLCIITYIKICFATKYDKCQIEDQGSIYLLTYKRYIQIA